MDFSAIMEQVQSIGEKVKKQKDNLKNLRVESNSGGGMVKVVMSGEGKLLKLDIEKTVGDDLEMLADLIIAAVNDAVSKVAVNKTESISQLTGGMDLSAMGIEVEKFV